MPSEALERVYETLLDRNVQTEIAQILLVARDAGIPLRQIRPFLGHSIIGSLETRGVSNGLSLQDVQVIHSALRDFITDLFLELPEPSSVPGEGTDVESNIEVTRRRLQLPLFVQTLRAHFKKRVMEETIGELELDANSGLMTKTAALKLIEKLIQKNPHRKVAVFFVDGDGLKKVNDISRLAGDACMRAQADRLKRGIRPADIVARWGNGDEMVHIALDVENEADLISIGERHLTTMRAEKVPVQDEAGKTLELNRTLSVGCTMGEVKDLFELIQLADDKALTRAKGGEMDEDGNWATLQKAPHASEGKPGRNRLCIYPSGAIHGEVTTTDK